MLWGAGTAGIAQMSAASSAISSQALRAARADRMVKGRLTGNAWDEMALLAADICGCPALPAPQSMLK